MLTYTKNFLTSVLMVSMIAPFLYFGIAPKKAEAFDMAETVSSFAGAASACLIQGAIEEIFSWLGIGGSEFSNEDSVPVEETNASLLNDTETTAESTAEQLFKECVLDPIIWVVKNAFIDYLVQSIMDWINVGFDEGAVFLTEMHPFFRRLADLTFKTFINESGLEEWLCEPFVITIQESALELSQRPSAGPMGEAACTLEDVFGPGRVQVAYSNMVEDGDIMFEGGGITAAMSLGLDSNNEYGSLFNVQEEASSRISEVVSAEAKQLDWANGYFSGRCIEENGHNRITCTPGDLIAKQIDDWLGGGLGQLEVADEVSEILSELIGGLVHEIFFGEDGEGLISGRRPPESPRPQSLRGSNLGVTLEAPPEITEAPEPVPPEGGPIAPPEGEWVYIPSGGAGGEGGGGESGVE